MTRDDHSASRRVDVLAEEAPQLIAAPRPALYIVVNMESDEPELLGTYSETEESAVWYITTEGHYKWANDDCVRVVKVEL